MNSTLQCFYNTPYLNNKINDTEVNVNRIKVKLPECIRYDNKEEKWVINDNYFKKVKNKNGQYDYDYKSIPLAVLYLLTYKNTNNNPNFHSFYVPDEFKKSISALNPLFEGIAANDAKDLVNFIIMRLHQELNNPMQQNANNNQNTIIDQTNKIVTYNNFYNDFHSNNKSPISDQFYAINCTETQCQECKTKIYNFQTYFFLIFPLEEVRKFKQNQNMFNNTNEVSIYDCFNYNNKIDLMSGENSMYCKYCKKMKFQYMIVLIIIIKLI